MVNLTYSWLLIGMLFLSSIRRANLQTNDILIYELTIATIAKRTINVMQYNSKWASFYANFDIALQFISEWSSGCGFVKLFKKFPRPEDIKIIKLLEWLHLKLKLYLTWYFSHCRKVPQRLATWYFISTSLISTKKP